MKPIAKFWGRRSADKIFKDDLTFAARRSELEIPDFHCDAAIERRELFGFILTPDHRGVYDRNH